MDDRERVIALSRHRRSPGKAWSYTWLGAVLGQGAPLGALAVETLAHGGSPLGHLYANPLLYAYMSVATGVAFSVFGNVLGRSADALIRRSRALRRANHRFKWLSEVDALTGVLNRRAIHARLHAELKRAERDGAPVAILMLDLDHFKHVNDTFGHAAGDRVLRRVGRHLRRMARATDSLGRVGGEEFLVVLPATGISEAQSSAERLRVAIGARPANPSTPPVTVSIGVLVLRRPDPARVGDCLRLVDQAMYMAKAEGRNRVALSPLCTHGRPAAQASGRTRAQ